MAWPQSLPNLSDTLSYFDKYNYPLTLDEIRYWSSIPHPPAPSPTVGEGNKRGEVQKKHGFYFLPNRQKLVALRKQREEFSKAKWVIAHHQAAKLAKLPFIMAIFVTGALAMNNCPQDDDIDLMIITKAHTLWITRFFIDLYLKFLNLRRPLPKRYPLNADSSNKICDNLWLDFDHLAIQHNHSLYTSHEILQAKCIFDRGDIHSQFLKQNSWVKKYLPVAYLSLLKLPSPKLGEGNARGEVFWKFLNLLFFAVQWLYMKPKMTSEKVGLGFAFFHPTKSP